MPAKVTISNNGPISIEGDFEIYDAQGKVYGLAGRTKIGLCRCGQSENKPFCDGGHGKCGFQSTTEARELAPPKPRV